MNKELLELIAINLAQFHRIQDIPLSQVGGSIVDKIQLDLSQVTPDGLLIILQSIFDVKSVVSSLKSFNYLNEIQWLENITRNYPIAFVHSNLHSGNIRVKHELEKQISNDGRKGSYNMRFIDLDNTGYRSRGEDFARFFSRRLYVT